METSKEKTMIFDSRRGREDDTDMVCESEGERP